MKEVITSLECRLIEALSMIKNLKAEVKPNKEGAKTGGSTSPDHDKEDMVEAPKPSIFKSVRDTQEV